MPRHPKPRAHPRDARLSTAEELRNLRLAVQLRTDQVKLRRLEWDTQRIALPHISPLPGDSDLQMRTPMTQADLPKPKEPKQPPPYESHMDSKVYETLVNLYARDIQNEWDRNPYNWLASISAQKRRDAKG